MRVVICGGGVIGACTAYFLSRRGIDVTVVERTEVAAAASGKAGGFLAGSLCTAALCPALCRSAEISSVGRLCSRFIRRTGVRFVATK